MEPEEEIQEFEKESRLKKIFISFFLLFLILSYFLVSPSIFSILESLFESNTVEGNTIILEDYIIIFTGNTYDDLQKNYYKNQSVEFVACLEGKKEAKEYTIQRIYLPEIFDQSFDHISFKPCSETTIALLHSHPYRRCIASQQDLITLNNLKEINPERLMVIMCDPNRFSVYD